MLRRSILQLSSCRSHGWIPIRITTQMPSYLASRRAFTAPSRSSGPEGPGPTDEGSKSGSFFPKVFLGGVAIGVASVAAYRTGYLDKYLGKERHSTLESVKVPTGKQDQLDLQGSRSSPGDLEPIADSRYQDPSTSTSDVEHYGKDIVANSGTSLPEDMSIKQGERPYQVNDNSEQKPEHVNHIQEDQIPNSLKSTTQSDDTSYNVNKPSEEDHGLKNPEVIHHDQQMPVEITPPLYQETADGTDSEKNSVPVTHATPPDPSRDDLGDTSNQPASLLGEYYLKNESEEPSMGSRKSEDLHGINEGGYVSGDGKLVLDFLQAIHAAEERQAELDARTYTEEKRAMKAKYEKELRDARARELMYAEREAILEKELNKERVKAAAALKALQEGLEEKHRAELENKANEAQLELKKVQELAAAELASAIASEKASQIEKMAEANLHINALCMAFYARSEEARQSHSVHKLALGALALEDALSKGLPIQKEIESLRTYLEGIDKESLLDLVLFSLPEETRTKGTDTLLQLNHKFDALKGTIRHFGLIPPGGGGILSHSLAHLASAIKVSEADQSGDGIESLMNRVDSFLAQGKLIEAADALENGVKGTQAAEVVGDWVKQARNRAIAEQALTLLQSYATSISLT